MKEFIKSLLEPVFGIKLNIYKYVHTEFVKIGEHGLGARSVLDPEIKKWLTDNYIRYGINIRKGTITFYDKSDAVYFAMRWPLS